MKSKVIAVAAAIAASASVANAADLNKPAKVAVDYVKVCDAYGAGFFYIPGSDTCLKISGYARAGFEYGVSNSVRTKQGTGGTIGNIYGGSQGSNRSTNTTNSYVRGDVQFDARTNTQYGLLRSFIDTHADLGTSASNSAVTSVRLDAAYIQFAGLTAGRAPSMFGFYGSDVFDQHYGQVSDNVNTNLIAYTASFGNGITATLSLEDPTTSDNLATNASNNGASFRRNGFTFNYGALNAPDVVANLDVLQAWGHARLGVAAHQVYGATTSPATKWGYAVEGTVVFNVPQLGAGDTIGLTAAYGQGAGGYVNGAGDYNGNFMPSAGNIDLGADATWSAASGLKLTRAWSVMGGFTHNFAPEFEFNGAVGYENVTNGGSGVNGLAATNIAGGVGTGNNGFTFGQLEAAAQLKWKPVKQFSITPYVEFRNINFSTGTANNYQLLTKNATAATFAVRVRRDF